MKVSRYNRILFLLLSAAAPSKGVNVVADPGFELSTPGAIADNGGISQWGNFNVTAGNAVVQTSVVHSGANALVLNANPTGSQGFTIVYQNSGSTLAAPQVEGQKWNYSFWVYTPGGSGSFDYDFPASNPNNQDVLPAGANGTVVASSLTANTWTLVSGTFTTADYTPDRTRMKANFRCNNSTSTFYIDDINLSLVEPPKWLGASGTAWGTAGNWTPSGVPLATDAVTFGSAGSVGSVSLGAVRTQIGVNFESTVPTTVSGSGFSLTLDNGASPAVVASEGTHTISSPVALLSPLRFTGTSGLLSLSGGISGGLGLTKEGAGTVALSGANTYTGATAVTGGSLLVNGGSLTSAIAVSGTGALGGTGSATTTATVSSGGALAPGTLGTVGAMTMDDLTLNSGSIFSLDFGPSTNDAVTLDTLTINAGSLRLLAAGTSNPFDTVGVYTVATFNTLVGNPATLNVINPAAGRNYTLGVVGNTLRLTVSIGTVRIWNGGGNPDAQWNTPANWSGIAIVNNSRLEFGPSPTAPASNNNIAGGTYQNLVFGPSAPSYQITGNAVTLSSDASGNAVLNDSPSAQTIGLPIQIGGVSGLAANGAQVTVSGAISGGGSVVKKGTQLVVFSGNNSFSGGVTVQPGNAVVGDNATLVGVASASALGSGPLVLPSAGVNNASGAPLVLSTTNAQTWSGDVSFTGPDLTMGTSAATLTADTILHVTNALSLGSFAGASKLELEGGIVSLTSSPAGALGELQINNGQLKLTSGNPTLTLGNFESFRQRSATAVSHLEMSTGTVSIPGRWRIGYDYAAGSASITGGTINHTDGDLEIAFNGGTAYVNFSGNAVYNGAGRLINMGQAWQSKTTLKIRGNASVTTGDVIVGSLNSVPASYNLSDLTVKDTATLNVNGNLIVGREGESYIDAQFNQMSGTTTVTGGVKFGGDDIAFGSLIKSNVNLSGGTLSTVAVGNNGGNSVLAFMGGNLVITSGATSNQVSGDHIYLYQNANIDTGGNSVLVIGTLENPAGSGVASVPVTAAGTGYQFAPPMVRISGGSGIGATAVAEVDAISGTVTGITITCPGSGYADGDGTLVELLGGSGTGATVGSPAMASNSSFNGGLTKSGTGTMTFNSASNYKGETNILGGTLTIFDECFDDNSNIRIAAGATLDLLTFGSTDTVKRLFIGGVQQTTGVWGAIGSGAAHETAAITGDGMLLVTDATSGSAYATWASSFGSGFNATNNGPSQDPDNDGIRNVLEFVLGGNPLTSDRSKLPVQTQDATNIYFTFNRADQSETEVSLVVEYGTTLTGWTGIAVGAATVPPVNVVEGSGATPDVVTVTIPRSNAVGGKIFARLKAVK